MGKMFGTDGIRGVSNSELSCELALAVGKAAAEVLIESGGHKAKVLIGKDTRLSSDMLESVMAAGFASAGADVVLLGVLPTPAVSFLVKELGADAGVMISASHNPAEYNGIKIFGSSGHKLSDALENDIEGLIEKGNIPIADSLNLGRITADKKAVEQYTAHIMKSGRSLEGLKIALDCANGSASRTAEKIFCGLGAKCVIINDNPDGLNINAGCGSLHIEGLRELVLKEGCDVGFAFDGDADRCIAISASGQVLDGDILLSIFAGMMKDENRLKQDTLVVTKVSNLGLLRFARSRGIQVVQTEVGDRYVLEQMLKGGFVLGGEQSGHIILSDILPTGDGELTGVTLASIMAATGKTADELASVIQLCPQITVNVPINPAYKPRLAKDETIRRTIRAAEERLGEDGRLIVRPSGTEPLVRVMVEYPEEAMANEIAASIAETIKERLS